MLKELLIESNYIIDESYIQIYFDFLHNCKVNELTDKYEKHHILPRALFPELTKNRQNIINLTPRNHFMAHYYLAKLIKSKETLFAFNQMRRVLKKYKSVISDISQLSMLYEEFRMELSQIISNQNTGWFSRLSADEQAKQRKKMSDRSKGKVPVKYPDGTTTSISNQHPDFINKVAVPVQTGTKRSDKAIENFKKVNSSEVKGYPYHNPVTLQIKYFHHKDAPADWIKGHPIRENSGKPGASWYHDPLSKRQGRFYLDEIPDGWVKGRINFGNAKPFSKTYQPNNGVPWNKTKS